MRRRGASRQERRQIAISGQEELLGLRRRFPRARASPRVRPTDCSKLLPRPHRGWRYRPLWQRLEAPTARPRRSVRALCRRQPAAYAMAGGRNRGDMPRAACSDDVFGPAPTRSSANRTRTSRGSRRWPCWPSRRRPCSTSGDRERNPVNRKRHQDRGSCGGPLGGAAGGEPAAAFYSP